MHIFWEHGFEASTVAALTQAMGITPPSLYAAFQDKRGLFREAIARYLGGIDAPADMISKAATARDAARELLTLAAMGDTRPDSPRGCLLASSIVSSSPAAADIREELAAIRRNIEAALLQRIERDIQLGLLPQTCDAANLAGHMFAVVQGMSTLAKDGASRSKLLGIVDSAMAGWDQMLRVRPLTRDRGHAEH